MPNVTSAALMKYDPRHALGQRSTSGWLQFILAGPIAFAISLLAGAAWDGVKHLWSSSDAGWNLVMGEIFVAGGWSVLGAVVAVLVLRWLRGEGQRAKRREWPAEKSFRFVAESCTIHQDGTFNVYFLCINRSAVTWTIRRSVLTNLRSDQASALVGDIEDNSIHQNKATVVPPGGVVRTQFRGQLNNLAPGWKIGAFVSIYMGQAMAPSARPAGHLVVYGEAGGKDETVLLSPEHGHTWVLVSKVQA